VSARQAHSQRSPDDIRELDRLRAQNARLNADLDAQHRQLKRARQVPVAKKASFVQPTFELVDPRSKPQIGTKVLAPLTPPLALGRQMGAALVAELRQMTIETRALIKALAQGPEDQLSQVQAAMDAPPADGSSVSTVAEQRLNVLKERYRQRFEALAEQWSRRMIVDVVAQSSAQLNLGLKEVADRMAIHSTMATPRMRAVVEASTQACTALIKRIPEKYLGEVQTQVMSAITTGSGLGQLVPYLTKRYKGDARHAHLTALDQIRKASENVNAARLQSLGVEEYVWIHTGGERYPRKLHQSYNGQTFRYDDPPVIDERTGTKGKPGDAIFCRCRARPVVRFAKMAAA
jgi:SPP1 gp7 family putative phage head morphogenesis protein